MPACRTGCCTGPKFCEVTGGEEPVLRSETFSGRGDDNLCLYWPAAFSSQARKTGTSLSLRHAAQWQVQWGDMQYCWSQLTVLSASVKLYKLFEVLKKDKWWWGGAVIDTSFITGGSKRRSVGLIVCGNCLLVLLVKVYWSNVRVWEVKKLRLGDVNCFGVLSEGISYSIWLEFQILHLGGATLRLSFYKVGITAFGRELWS